MFIKKVNKTQMGMFVIFLGFLLILLLTTFNLNTIFRQKQTVVLGVNTKNDDVFFWKDFLDKNPQYVPGWIELGETNKAREIDPNYKGL